MSWGPQGATVVAGRRGPLRPRVSSLGLDRLGQARPGAPRTPVRGPVALRRPALDRAGRRQHDVHAGSGRPDRRLLRRGNVRTIHRVLAGYAMVAISTLSDIIVVPQESLARLTPLPTRPDEEHADLEGAALQFLGSGEARPLPYGVRTSRSRSRGCWRGTRTPRTALVVGREAFRRGFYLLDTAPAGRRGRRRGTSARRRGSRTGRSRSTTRSSSRPLRACSRGSSGDLVRLRAAGRRARAGGTDRLDPLTGGTLRLGILAAMNVSVVGAGRVGTAMAVLLGRAGHRIVAVAGRGPTRDRASRFLSDVPFLDPADAARAGELVLIGVPDDDISRDRRTDRRSGRVPLRAVGGPPVGGIGPRRPRARASGRCPAARDPSAADVPRRRRRPRTHPRVRHGRHRRGRRGLHARGAHRRRPHGPAVPAGRRHAAAVSRGRRLRLELPHRDERRSPRICSGVRVCPIRWARCSRCSARAWTTWSGLGAAEALTGPAVRGDADDDRAQPRRAARCERRTRSRRTSCSAAPRSSSRPGPAACRRIGARRSKRCSRDGADPHRRRPHGGGRCAPFRGRRRRPRADDGGAARRACVVDPPRPERTGRRSSCRSS